MTTEHIGTPLRDGQHDPPPACSVCGHDETTTEQGTVVRSTLTTVPDARGVNRHRHVCLPCLERALKSAGPAVPDLSIRACVGSHAADDDTPYAVVAVWPPRSYAPPPYWLACTRHLSEALDALAAERTTT